MTAAACPLSMETGLGDRCRVMSSLVGRASRVHVFVEEVVLPHGEALAAERPKGAAYFATWAWPGTHVEERTAARGPQAPSSPWMPWRVPLKHSGTSKLMLYSAVLGQLATRPLRVQVWRQDPPKTATGLGPLPPPVLLGYAQVDLLPLLSGRRGGSRPSGKESKWLSGSHLLVNPASKNMGGARVRIRLLMEVFGQPPAAAAPASGPQQQEEEEEAELGGRKPVEEAQEETLGDVDMAAGRDSGSSAEHPASGALPPSAPAFVRARGSRGFFGAEEEEVPLDTSLEAEDEDERNAATIELPTLRQLVQQPPPDSDWVTPTPTDGARTPAEDEPQPRQESGPPVPDPAEELDSARPSPLEVSRILGPGDRIPAAAAAAATDGSSPSLLLGKDQLSVRVDSALHLLLGQLADGGMSEGLEAWVAFGLDEPGTELASTPVMPIELVQPASAEGDEEGSCRWLHTALLPWSASAAADLSRLSSRSSLLSGPMLVLRVFYRHAETGPEGALLGCAVVDLELLARGSLESLDGWYNIVDFAQRIRGQIRLGVVPLGARAHRPQQRPQQELHRGRATEAGRSSAEVTDALELISSPPRRYPSASAPLDQSSVLLASPGSSRDQSFVDARAERERLGSQLQELEALLARIQSGDLAAGSPRRDLHQHPPPLAVRSPTSREPQVDAQLGSALAKAQAQLDAILQAPVGALGGEPAAARQGSTVVADTPVPSASSSAVDGGTAAAVSAPHRTSYLRVGGPSGAGPVPVGRNVVTLSDDDDFTATVVPFGFTSSDDDELLAPAKAPEPKPRPGPAQSPAAAAPQHNLNDMDIMFSFRKSIGPEEMHTIE